MLYYSQFITKSKNENILVPRNIESRADKLRMNNMKILQQETINGDLVIDDGFLNIPKESVKTKVIRGDVTVNYNSMVSLPEWLKNITVEGNFDCGYLKLRSLEGSPVKVMKSFGCMVNQLKSLAGCPEYVGDDFNCSYNPLDDYSYAPKYIGGNFILYSKTPLTLDVFPKDMVLKGDLIF